MTLMLPRLFFGLAGLALLAILVKLILLCSDPKKPFSSCTSCTLFCLYYFFANIINLVTSFTWNSYHKFDVNDPRVNYEEYLGPNWKEELAHRQEKGLKASLIASNHCGYIDVLAYLGSPMSPGFVSRGENQNVPVLSALINGL